MGSIVNAGRCSPCRLALLRLAISTVGPSSHSCLPPGPHLRGIEQQGRPYSKSGAVLSGRVPPDSIPRRVDIAGNTPATAHEDGNPSLTSTAETLPWYLQVEIPQQAPQSISNRQWIPDLPAASPPLLQPLLEHISVDLGLDDLSTIDLRNLDPPPALGANLIMILGTARSEKHLHVSADRLCRWLRSNHKLTPSADGLLGRNELKLKLKRKASRSKLLRSIGAPEKDVVDDGMRTGWICVNIGRVEGEGSGIGEAKAEGGFVGFGGGSQGVRLVVQMLTKEKREELDLEGLWRGLVEHKAHRDTMMEEVGKKATGSHAAETHTSIGANNVLFVSPTQGAHVRSLSLAQTRSFHTPTRYLTMVPSLQASTSLGNSSMTAKVPNNSPSPGTLQCESMMRDLLSGVDNGKHRYVYGILRHMNSLNLGGWTGDGEGLLLRTYLNHLRRMRRRGALESLGLSPPSHFMFSFLQSIPIFPGPQHWQCQVELLCFGIKLGHQEWTKTDLMALFERMCMSTIDIPVTTFLAILEGVLNRDGVLGDGCHQGRKKWDSEVDMAIRVLEEMSSQGHEVLIEDVMVPLLERVCSKKYKANNPYAAVSERCLSDIIYAYDIPFTKEESLLRILRLYARKGDWVNFWLFWKGVAMRALRRSEALYALMFRSVAKTRNQMECISALRIRIPDMESEEPPVQLVGEVAREVKRCLIIADPCVSEDAKKTLLVDGEWTRLWRRCEHGLRQSSSGSV